MTISLIVACDKYHGIAKNGTIPWKYSEELKYFSKQTRTTRDPTRQNAILMGRKTWESLPIKPLPHRINIVLSSTDHDYDLTTTAKFVKSIPTALEYVRNNADTIEDLYVIGGEQIYRTFLTEHLSEIDRVYYSEIQEDYQCDQFFPDAFTTFLGTTEGHTRLRPSVADPASGLTATGAVWSGGCKERRPPTTNCEGDFVTGAVWQRDTDNVVKTSSDKIIYYCYTKKST